MTEAHIVPIRILCHFFHDLKQKNSTYCRASTGVRQSCKTQFKSQTLNFHVGWKCVFLGLLQNRALFFFQAEMCDEKGGKSVETFSYSCRLVQTNVYIQYKWFCCWQERIRSGCHQDSIIIRIFICIENVSLFRRLDLFLHHLLSEI